MARIYDSITELVGHTPLVEFHRLEKVLGLKGRIAGKLEYFNPAGSHKDRAALEIIEQAESRGEISPEKTTLVEFTSGNMGIGIASVAAAKGYKFKVGIQEGVSIERKKLLEAYGSQIVNPPKELIAGVFEKGIEAFNDVYQWMLDTTPDSWTTRQLSNPDNVGAHYRHTGPEIWEDTDGDLAAVVAAVGTAGTIRGISDYIHEKTDKVKIFAVEPGADDKILTGIHNFTDVPAERIPPSLKDGNALTKNVFDEVFVGDPEGAFQAARDVAKSDGILVGNSSGAALWGAEIVAKKPEYEGKNIVVIFPDTGLRYLSTKLFED